MKQLAIVVHMSWPNAVLYYVSIVSGLWGQIDMQLSLLQVLVYHDLLGMMQHPHHAKVTPKFCKQVGQELPSHSSCQLRVLYARAFRVVACGHWWAPNLAVL